MSQNKTNFAVPLAFVGMMFFAIGFALGINSFLIPVLKGALSLPSGVAYLLLAATFVPFLIFGYPASATIAKIGYKRTMALSFLIFAVAFILFVLSAKLENFILFLIASFVSGAANAYLQASVNPYITILGPIESAAKRMSIMGICNKLAWPIPSIFIVWLLGKDVNLISIDDLDNVDEEEILSPRDWSGKTLKQFMLSFGPISSLFDIVTFLFLYYL
jgi:fucose permease